MSDRLLTDKEIGNAIKDIHQENPGVILRAKDIYLAIADAQRDLTKRLVAEELLKELESQLNEAPWSRRVVAVEDFIIWAKVRWLK